MLTRIRNAQMVGKDTLRLPFSRFKEELANILKKEGFIEDYSSKGTGNHKYLTITLRYGNGLPVISGLRLLSKPSQRFYARRTEIPKNIRGGITILSTSRGLITASEAKKLGIGGELICEIW